MNLPKVQQKGLFLFFPFMVTLKLITPFAFLLFVQIPSHSKHTNYLLLKPSFFQLSNLTAKD